MDEVKMDHIDLAQQTEIDGLKVTDVEHERRFTRMEAAMYVSLALSCFAFLSAIMGFLLTHDVEIKIKGRAAVGAVADAR